MSNHHKNLVGCVNKCLSEIGLCENSTSHAGIADDLAGTGLSARGVDAVTTALAKPGVVSDSRTMAKVPAGSGLATV